MVPFRNLVAVCSLEEHAQRISRVEGHQVDVPLAALDQILHQVLLCEIEHRKHVVIGHDSVVAVEVPKSLLFQAFLAVGLTSGRL